MNRSESASLGVAVLGGVLMLAACASDKEGSQAESDSTVSEAPLRYEDSATVVMMMGVEAVDYASRRITLSDSSGSSTTYVVGPQVKRLDEVKVGDDVKVTFTASLEAELRAPTAEEEANPISITEVTGRSPRAADPAGGTQRRVRIVTTVEGVDLGKMLVTLKGPMGDTTTVRARSEENIRKLRVGDTIVVTYVETALVSLVKAGGGAG